MVRKILVCEKNLSEIKFERLEKSLVPMKNNLTDPDNNMYLTSDSFIDKDNIVTGSIKVGATDMRYFARIKFSSSFVRKKNFSLI